ncbi:trypsin-like peptidase domain-containing protein [[Eubacterium] cellulosolvens]
MEQQIYVINKRLKIYGLTLFLIMIILSIGFGALYINLNRQFDSLKRRNIALEEEVQVLRSRYEVIKKTPGSASISSSEIYEFIRPSVVEIRATFESFIGESAAGGTGFIYDHEGHIITNAHVVNGAQSITITYADENTEAAHLIGFDLYSDLAVLKVNTSKENLRPVLFGNSDELKIGEPIIAVGNPFGLSGTVTQGIISQTDRILPAAGNYLIVGVIQVDAAINPGNSGGPLLNTFGEVVGVNTALASQSGTFSGIGFAIPSKLVERVVPSLIEKGSYKHPWIGISGFEISPDIEKALGMEGVQGFLVTDVINGSPAEKAGLRGGSETITVQDVEIKAGGDVLLEIDGRGIRKIDDILLYIEYYKEVGDEVIFKVLRKDEVLPIPIILGERPSPT